MMAHIQDIFNQKQIIPSAFLFLRIVIISEPHITDTDAVQFENTDYEYFDTLFLTVN